MTREMAAEKINAAKEVSEIREAQKTNKEIQKMKNEERETELLKAVVPTNTPTLTPAEIAEKKRINDAKKGIKNYEDVLIPAILQILDSPAIDANTRTILEGQIAGYELKILELKEIVGVTERESFWLKNAVDITLPDDEYKELTIDAINTLTGNNIFKNGQLYYFDEGKLFEMPMSLPNKEGVECPIKGHYAGMRPKSANAEVTEVTE